MDRERRITPTSRHKMCFNLFHYSSFHEELYTAGILKPFHMCNGWTEGERRIVTTLFYILYSNLFYYSSFHDELFAAGILKPFQGVMDGQREKDAPTLRHIPCCNLFHYCSFHDELFAAGILKPFQGVMDGQREKDGSSQHYVTPNGSNTIVKHFLEQSGTHIQVFWREGVTVWTSIMVRNDEWIVQLVIYYPPYVHCIGRIIVWFLFYRVLPQCLFSNGSWKISLFMSLLLCGKSWGH